MIWFIISTFSSLVAIFLWIKEELKTNKMFNQKYLYLVFFIFLSTVSIYQGFELEKMNNIKKEAITISRNWPKIDRINFCSKGERYGIILSGQTFLEKHKHEFPETYSDFVRYKNSKLKNYINYPITNDLELSDYDNLENVCSTLITIIDDIKK